MGLLMGGLVGGAAFAAASMLAPIESANGIAVSALGSSVLLVIARFVSARSRGRASFKVISPNRLHELVVKKEVTVIDVKSHPSWAMARVPGALNLDPVHYGSDALPADKDSAVVFYCSNSMCRKAPNAARQARRMGYHNVQVMTAGIKGWVATRLPVDSGE